MQYEEKEARKSSGMFVLLLNIVLMLASIGGCVAGCIMLSEGANLAFCVTLISVTGLYACLIGPILFAGLKILKPNEALVLTLFGEYYGTLKGSGYFFVNPFVTATSPAKSEPTTGTVAGERKQSVTLGNVSVPVSGGAAGFANKRISLKAQTLNNDKQKVNDVLGNPIIIGIVVVWKVVNTAKAVFNVDNYVEFLSIQCDFGAPQHRQALSV